MTTSRAGKKVNCGGSNTFTAHDDDAVRCKYTPPYKPPLSLSARSNKRRQKLSLEQQPRRRNELEKWKRNFLLWFQKAGRKNSEKRENCALEEMLYFCG